MSPSGMIGRILKVAVLRPRIKGKSWAQLVTGMVACRDNFLRLIEADTEVTAAVGVAGEMSVLDTLAHLAAANFAIADRLDALRTNAPLPPEPPDLFPGHGAWNLSESRANYIESWNRLAEAAATEIRSDRTAGHPFFGAMKAREWVMLVAFHHEYHARKIQRVKMSAEYREAQGAAW